LGLVTVMCWVKPKPGEQKMGISVPCLPARRAPEGNPIPAPAG